MGRQKALDMLPPLLLLLLGAANANPAAIQAEADLAEIVSFAGRDFADPSTYFDAAESRRASKYLQKARHWQNEVKRVAAADESGNAEEEEDVVVYSWLASQHLRAAVHLASGSVQVLTEAAVVAAEIAKGPEGTDKDARLVYQCIREACEGASSAAALAAQMTTLVNTAEGRVRREVKKMLNHWKKKDECGAGMESQSNPFASVRNLLQTSAQQQCGVDGCLLKQHTLWPVRVATGQLDASHARLSEIAVKKYIAFSKQQRSNRPEDINNAFFSFQAKSDGDVAHYGKSTWPELYASTEYIQMRQQIRKVATEQAMSISKLSKEEIEKLSLVVWAAVYTADTPHLTHVHESSVVSGSYYSQAPSGTAPIVFMDPRGGQPMHNDAIQPETEPEAPFVHSTTFFPTTGDIVIFPSYLPHRVPPAPKSKSLEPRVSWAFNLEGGDFAWLSITH